MKLSNGGVQVVVEARMFSVAGMGESRTATAKWQGTTGPGTCFGCGGEASEVAVPARSSSFFRSQSVISRRFSCRQQKKKIDRRPKADWLKWGASVDPVIIGPKFLARSSSYLAPHSIHISTDNLTQTNQNKTACFPFLAENLTFCGKNQNEWGMPRAKDASTGTCKQEPLPWR